MLEANPLLIKLVPILLFIITFFLLLWWLFSKYFLPRFKSALQNTFLDFMEDAEQIKKNNKNPFPKESERKKDKNKEKELENKKELENEREVEVISKSSKQKQKIVGLSFKVLGPFTKRFIDNFFGKNKDIDFKDINEKGYFQAHEIARQNVRGASKDFSRKL